MGSEMCIRDRWPIHRLLLPDEALIMLTFTVAEAYELVQLGDWTSEQFASWAAAQWQAGYDEGRDDGFTSGVDAQRWA